MARLRRQVQGDATVHYVSPRAKRSRPRLKLQPPLIPMIDVTFQLLIFFMVTTTFRQQEGQIPGSLPEKGGVTQGEMVELRPILIVLRPTGDDRMGCVYEMSGHGAAVDSPAELHAALRGRQKALASDEVPVVIQPRSDVRWQYVVEAFNQAVRAKFKNIGFAAAH